MIFDLIIEGAETRVFSDAFLSRTGQAGLLGWLSVLALGMKLPRRLWMGRQHPLEVFYLNTQAIGFAYLIINANERVAEQALEMCAIAPAFRGRGHGQAMMHALIQRMPIDMGLTICCTKFATRMQAILRRLHFTRDGQQLRAGAINLHGNRYLHTNIVGSQQTGFSNTRGFRNSVVASAQAALQAIFFSAQGKEHGQGERQDLPGA